jgi:hypothetical protein
MARNNTASQGSRALPPAFESGVEGRAGDDEAVDGLDEAIEPLEFLQASGSDHSRSRTDFRFCTTSYGLVRVQDYPSLVLFYRLTGSTIRVA